MALSAELEAMLALITDEKAREARRQELTELSENGLRQADYSRKMNELAEARKAQEAKHQQNVAWYNRANEQYKTIEADLRTAQERVAALESVQGSPGNSPQDETELEAQLAAAKAQAAEANKKLGELSNTVTNFNKMVEEGKIITAEKFEEEVNKRGDALGAALLDIIDLQDRHRKDFGTDLDRKELLTEAQKHGGNLTQAYEVVTAKAREEKLRKEIEADVEKKWQEKARNSNVPYAESGEPVLGPLQQRLQKKETGIPEDVPADGSGRLANLIGAELRQEGKGF